MVRELCQLKAPGNPYADREGYVPFGTLVDYSAGRSNGCTSWAPSDAERILALVENKPTTLYIYPESTDIVAVTRAVKAGRSTWSAGLYWNDSCLREIGSPNFWPKENSRTSPPSIQERSPAAAAAADLQRAVKFISSRSAVLEVLELFLPRPGLSRAL